MITERKVMSVALYKRLRMNIQTIIYNWSDSDIIFLYATIVRIDILMAYLEIHGKYLGLVYMGIVLPAIVDRIATT